MILLVPALLLAMWAQFKVKSTYAHYAQVANRSGLTGARVASLILRDAGIEVTNSPERASGPACAIEPIGGELTDHYDPRDHTLRLSEGIYDGRSVAALGIAAHEVGHAIQHAKGYAPMALRSIIYPASSIGSTLAFPLFFIGLLVPRHLAIGGMDLGPMLMNSAILLFAMAVMFTLVTLPVEFNASNRALKALAKGGYLAEDEMAGARKVLSAAAMTYVAAAAMALMQLLRLILLAQRRD